MKTKKSISDLAFKNKTWKTRSDEIEKSKDWYRDSMKIALLVRRHLRESGMTQVEMAEKMGLTKQSVSKILKGQSNFTIGTIRKIERVLNIELMTIGEVKLTESKGVVQMYERVGSTFSDFLRNIDLSSYRLTQKRSDLFQYRHVFDGDISHSFFTKSIFNSLIEESIENEEPSVISHDDELKRSHLKIA